MTAHTRPPATLWAALILVISGLASGAAGCDSAAGGGESSQSLVITAELDELPGHVGQNSMTLTIRDVADAPVGGADVVVTPDMPVHGHGSTEEPVVTHQGEGVYTAFPVTFTMPGAWVVNISASAVDGSTGSLSVDVEVE